MLQLRYIPNKGPNSHFFLPHPDQVPRGEARGLSFQFPSTPAFGTNLFEVGLTEDIVIVSLMALCAPVTPVPIPVAWVPPYTETYAFSLLFYHTHKGVQRQWQPQGVNAQLTCGTAANPCFLRVPYLMEKGDTITAEIANASYAMGGPTGLVNAGKLYLACDIYVALDGVHPEEG